MAEKWWMWKLFPSTREEKSSPSKKTGFVAVCYFSTHTHTPTKNIYCICFAKPYRRGEEVIIVVIVRRYDWWFQKLWSLHERIDKYITRSNYWRSCYVYDDATEH
jgi:hypothetical protein